MLWRLMREPLLHFLAIGGLIFLVFTALDDRREPIADVIEVTPERIDQLAAGYRSVWKRRPTAAELDALIEAYIQEEVYYREALALGLDRDDTVVRRRLRQKLEFITDTGADLLKPAAGELEAYFEANEPTYRQRSHMAFEQIYLGENPDPKTVSRALRALTSEPDTDRAAFAKRTLLPANLELSPPAAIDSVFGQGFFARLSNLVRGVWTGPVASGYGMHLVRVLERRPGLIPPMDEVRETVLRGWKAAKTKEIRKLHYDRLRARYVIKIHGKAGR
jgi:hypothetical protein